MDRIATHILDLDPILDGLTEPVNDTDLIGTVFGKDDANVVWRTKGAVSPVKNQVIVLHVGLFHRIAMEGAHQIKSGQLISSFSEQQLVDCSNRFGNNGCSGGYMDNAFRYIISSGGIVSNESYPYISSTTSRQSITCKFNKTNIVASFGSTYHGEK
ncbi:cathepsin L [Cavenderia fasciculata]|uniref:Cathepsin L n=1 Tax=Cavenderia fasciculata TaxID=261658 RepID=F4PYG8_CACFS|nr:cathepsin L [Cavenderia fasciculata]EGG19234.1 cathepsin L [Cavenderia fasciculata]|eukprot:XP_004357505.1 cathepsin L [Cavenderia fasciculata]